ncbi:MAG: hypothetical protein AAGA54_07100 [Myxococcota bacterium]
MALVPTGCFTENIVCINKGFRIEAKIADTAPLDGQLQPTDHPLSCVDATSGFSKPLEDLISVTETTWVGLEVVTDQHALKRIDEMMVAIEAGAGSALSPAHQATYTNLIESLVAQMQQSCTDSLVDPEYLNCSVYSAATLCEAYVAPPARARYLDFDLGPTYKRPEAFDTGTTHEGGGGWCYHYYDWDSGTESSPDTETSGDLRSRLGPVELKDSRGLRFN